jgi:DNA-binding response OmpR family regulator
MTNSQPTKILVVDDDPEVRAVLRRLFELEGYTVAEAGDGRQMRAEIDAGQVGLVTLDLNLGGEDGLALAREVRSGQNVPIIMITGKDDPVDRVVGLELGADDYITKPFHLREVLARVRAVLRRYAGSHDQHGPPASPNCATESHGGALTFEGYVLRPDRRELTGPDGAPVALTTAELNMLLMFAQRPARVLSRDNIMDLLKGQEWSPLDRSIDTLVARLRKKIEIDPDHPRLIKTVRGIGYAFAAEVERV